MAVIRVSTYKPYAKQQEFHRNPAKFRLFGGARGPGKSRAMLEEAIAVANFVPDGVGGSVLRPEAIGLNTIILRTSLTDLEGSVISKFKESDWFRKGLAKYSDQKKKVTFPNGATLQFGYAANETDLQQYLGQEYAFVGWDELGLVKDYKMFVNIAGSLRCPIPGVVCRMAGSANPGGPGHAWLRNMFVNGVPAPGMEAHQYCAKDYAYIPATYLDGPYKDDKEYLKNLLMQPKAIQRAWILGDWNIVAGAYFDTWDAAERHEDGTRNEHCMVFDYDALAKRPGSPTVDGPRWWTVWISIDWGFQHHAAVYWHTMDSGGNVYTFKELVIRKEGSRALAAKIIEYSEGMDVDAIYLSPDAKIKHDDDAHSIKQQMDEVFFKSKLPCTSMAIDDRIAGWLLMYQLLESGEWKIARTCKEALAGLPTLMINSAKREDITKNDTIADDVGDALRYGILSRLQGRVSKKPAAVVRQEILDAQPNMQAKYFADLRLQEAEQKKKERIAKIGRIPSWKEKMARDWKRGHRVG